MTKEHIVAIMKLGCRWMVLISFGVATCKFTVAAARHVREEMEDASRIVTGETTPDDTMGADTPTDDKPGDDLGDLDDLGSDDELDDIEGTEKNNSSKKYAAFLENMKKTGIYNPLIDK